MYVPICRVCTCISYLTLKLVVTVEFHSFLFLFGGTFWLFSRAPVKEQFVGFLHLIGGERLVWTMSASWQAIHWLILSKQSWIWWVLSTNSVASKVNVMSNPAALSSETGSLSPFLNFPWHPSSSIKHLFLSWWTSNLSALQFCLLILALCVLGYLYSLGN